MSVQTHHHDVIGCPSPTLRKLLRGQLPVLLQMCQLWSVLAALAHGEDSRAASWQFPELPYVQRFQLLGDDCGDPLGDLGIS